MMIEKVANTAIATGSSSAVFFGLTPGEWQAVGVVGGLILALAGLIVNVYFKARHLRLAERAYEDE